MAKLQQWTVLAAVVMPDHLHVIASPTDAHNAKLGNFSAALKRWIRREAKRSMELATGVFMPGCYGRMNRFMTKWLYVEDQPSAGMDSFNAQADWPYRIGLDELILARTASNARRIGKRERSPYNGLFNPAKRGACPRTCSGGL